MNAVTPTKAKDLVIGDVVKRGNKYVGFQFATVESITTSKMNSRMFDITINTDGVSFTVPFGKETIFYTVNA